MSEETVDDFYESKWLKSSDLNGASHIATIEAVTIETLGDPERPQRKPVLRLKGKQKGLVLNKVNALTISAAFGKAFAAWPGRQIELFSLIVQGPNGPIPGIRVRPLSTSEPAPVQQAAPLHRQASDF